jgi:iron(II)-dependent oxidoreductase
LDQYELLELKKWAEAYGSQSSQLVKNYISASKLAIEKIERRRRLRLLTIIGLYSTALVLAVLGITGWFNPYLYRPTQVMKDYWVDIPAGEFLLGSSETDIHADSDEGDQVIIYLDGFQIGRHEITNEQWNQCVRANACDGAILDVLDLPVVNVSWQDANDFCAWAGGRLPTEAEWEKAARGGIFIPDANGEMGNNPHPGRLYPWGNETPVCDLGSLFGANTFLCPYKGSLPVESFSPNPYGIYDMAGNVWEWVSDWYEKDYHASLSDGTNNPFGPVIPTGFRVTRGGSWDVNSFNSRAANRAWKIPDDVSNDVGFRCAR